MWIEATLARDDVDRVLAELLPLTVAIGADGDHVALSKPELIGHQDSRAEHVAHDKEVMASGKPLLNFHETIAVPSKEGGMVNVDIVTQKGLLRALGSNDIIGITVCFSLKDPVT